jgi:phospholipid/cholesterol/gamma-HCH transport system substrate-binding protein
VLWLARGGLASGYPLYTRFAWGQNLKQGQPVLLAGVTVGYVDNVDLRPEGYLDVMMRVNDQYHVPKGSKATVRAVGFFGDVAVALTPPIGGDLNAAYAPGDTVPAGTPEASVQQILERVDSIGAGLNATTRALQLEVVQSGGLHDLRKTIASTAALAEQLQTIAADQNRNITSTLEAYRRVARSLDSSAVDSTIRNLRASSAAITQMSNQLNQSATSLNEILGKLNRGEGTAGKLLTDTLVYRNFRNTLATMDSLLADLKAHPNRSINVRIF